MLMMVCVLVGFAQVLLRLFVEGFLATERAEVVGLAFILRCASGGGGINVHAAYGIVYCSCHSNSFQLDYIPGGRTGEGKIA